MNGAKDNNYLAPYCPETSIEISLIETYLSVKSTRTGRLAGERATGLSIKTSARKSG